MILIFFKGKEVYDLQSNGHFEIIKDFHYPCYPVSYYYRKIESRIFMTVTKG